jgi:pyruvate decarboxylase
LYGSSIGYTVPAAQGASLAQRDMQPDPATRGRTILFVGDGSLQLTIQAISDMIRQRLDVIIFVINNDGYTVERYIHGMKAAYNDIQPWKYLEAPRLFGAPVDDASYPVIIRQVSTWKQLDSVIEDPTIKAGRGLIMIECIFEWDDAPDMMKKMADHVNNDSDSHQRKSAE